MISSLSGNLLFDYLNSKTAAANDAGTSTSGTGTGIATGASARARAAVRSQAALELAGSKPKALAAGQALQKQQAALAGDLRAAMGAAGVKLGGPVDVSIGSDGTVAVKGADADAKATQAFLKADTTRPGFATRIAQQAKDALALSAQIQQSASMSQAARYSATPGGVMALYTSLMPSGTTTAVFSLTATSSSLTYPGSLATKA